MNNSRTLLFHEDTYTYDQVEGHIQDILEVVGDGWEYSIVDVGVFREKYIGIVYKDTLLIYRTSNDYYHVGCGVKPFTTINEWDEIISEAVYYNNFQHHLVETLTRMKTAAIDKYLQFFEVKCDISLLIQSIEEKHGKTNPNCRKL